ncbi:MAG: hypothetical protein H6Q32_1034 [Bacteroidetes bacterium]|nr:hypothetical protein [Bacteroidota bacterium]
MDHRPVHPRRAVEALNLYYLVFNVLSIGQQMWTNKVHGNEPLRKVEPKKQGGLMSRIAKDLPKLK